MRPCSQSIPLVVMALAASAFAQDSTANKSRDTFLRVCGACHPADAYVSPKRSRDQWQEVVTSMVARGAKGSNEELAAVLEYLTTQYGTAPGGATQTAATPPANRPRSRPGQPGSDDKHVVDEAGATRGRKVYATECINCHGTHTRGSEKGADLIRSTLVLHDRYGNEIGPFLRKGHPTQTTPAANLTQAQIEDLSDFLHQELYLTLRSGLRIQNVLTGDPKAGAAYFNGEGKCNSCHSPTGDFAGIGKKYDPPTLQQRFLFPMAGGFGRGGGRGRGASANSVMVTVTPANGPAVTGVLLQMDDFNVSLRDAEGEYHSWKRTPSLNVVKKNPFDAHIALLDKYTDKNMHDIVAYLETLK